MFAAGATRCSPAEGQGRNGVPAGRQFAVIGRAALLPRVCGRVLLFSAKALLEYRHLRQCISAAGQQLVLRKTAEKGAFDPLADTAADIRTGNDASGERDDDEQQDREKRGYSDAGYGVIDVAISDYSLSPISALILLISASSSALSTASVSWMAIFFRSPVNLNGT
jgi:hypothetical protein